MRKTLTSLLAICYLLSNVAFVHASESNFWQERRKNSQHEDERHPQLAALPASMVNYPANPQDLLRQFPSLNKTLDSVAVAPKKSLALKVPSSAVPYIDAIPLNYGMVKEIYVQDRPSKKSPMVVLLQDVHMNQEAQQNLANILLSLNDKSTLLSVDNPSHLLVGVEGAFGSFDFKRFRSFDDKKIVKSIAAFFLQENKFAAPSYAGIVADQLATKFVGIDDPLHYAANVKAYVSAQEGKKSVQVLLEKEKRSLSDLKRKTLNADLLKFDAQRMSYLEGAGAFGDYISSLSRTADAMAGKNDGRPDVELVLEQFLAAYEMEKSLDFSKVETERARVVEKLATKLTKEELNQLVNESLAYRMGRISFADYYRAIKSLIDRHGIPLSATPAFDKYIRYVLLADGIKAEQLMAAVQRLENHVLNGLSRTENERNIMNQSRHLYLIEKLLDFSLTPEEWADYQGLKPILKVNLTPFENFYKEADVRSDRMVKRLVSQMESDNKIAVLVVGGFHTPKLTHLLKDRGLSYAVVQPKITKIEGLAGAEYLSIFTREKTPLDRLFDGEKLFLSPVMTANWANRGSSELFAMGEAVYAHLRGESVQPGAKVRVERIDNNNLLVIGEDGATFKVSLVQISKDATQMAPDGLPVTYWEAVSPSLNEVRSPEGRARGRVSVLGSIAQLREEFQHAIGVLAVIVFDRISAVVTGRQYQPRIKIAWGKTFQNWTETIFRGRSGAALVLINPQSSDRLFNYLDSRFVVVTAFGAIGWAVPAFFFMSTGLWLYMLSLVTVGIVLGMVLIRPDGWTGNALTQDQRQLRSDLAKATFHFFAFWTIGSLVVMNAFDPLGFSWPIMLLVSIEIYFVFRAMGLHIEKINQEGHDGHRMLLWGLRTLQLLLQGRSDVSPQGQIAIVNSPEGAIQIQSQTDLKARVVASSPPKHNFVKDAPIFGYRINSERFEDLPLAIRSNLGTVDKTSYGQDYLRGKVGSVVVLQMNGAQPDFYPIGHKSFQAYSVVPNADVRQKNAKLFNALSGVEGVHELLNAGDPNLVAILKTSVTPLIRMSEIGYPLEEEVTIKSSWGEQTKPAGKDAYLGYVPDKDLYYMVNSDASGLPISYVSAPSTLPENALAPTLTDSQIDELIRMLRGESYFRMLPKSGDGKAYEVLREYVKELIRAGALVSYKKGTDIYVQGKGKFHLILSGEVRLVSNPTSKGSIIPEFDGPVFARGSGVGSWAVAGQSGHWGEMRAVDPVIALTINPDQYENLILLTTPFIGKLTTAIDLADVRRLVELELVQGYGKGDRKLYFIKRDRDISKQIAKLEKSGDAKDKELAQEIRTLQSKVNGNDFIIQSADGWHVLQHPIQSGIKNSSVNQYLLQENYLFRGDLLTTSDPTQVKQSNGLEALGNHDGGELTNTEFLAMARNIVPVEMTETLNVSDLYFVKAAGEPMKNPSRAPPIGTIHMTFSDAEGKTFTAELPIPSHGVLDPIALSSSFRRSSDVHLTSWSISGLEAATKLFRLPIAQYREDINNSFDYNLDELVNQLRLANYEISADEANTFKKLFLETENRLKTRTNLPYTDLSSDFRIELIRLVSQWVAMNRMGKGPKVIPLNIESIGVLFVAYLYSVKANGINGDTPLLSHYKSIFLSQKQTETELVLDGYSRSRSKRKDWSASKDAEVRQKADWRGIKHVFSMGVDEMLANRQTTGVLAIPLRHHNHGELSRPDKSNAFPSLTNYNRDTTVIPDIHENIHGLEMTLRALGWVDVNLNLRTEAMSGKTLIQMGDNINRNVGPMGVAVLDLWAKLWDQAQQFNKDRPENEQIKIQIMLGNHELDLLHWDEKQLQTNFPSTPARILADKVRDQLREMIQKNILVVGVYVGDKTLADDSSTGAVLVHAGILPRVLEQIKSDIRLENQSKPESMARPVNGVGVVEFVNQRLKDAVANPGKWNFDHYIFGKSKARGGSKEVSGIIEADFGPWTRNDLHLALQELGVLDSNGKFMPGMDQEKAEEKLKEAYGGLKIWVGHNFSTDEERGIRLTSIGDFVLPNVMILDAGDHQVGKEFYEETAVVMTIKNGVPYQVYVTSQEKAPRPQSEAELDHWIAVDKGDVKDEKVKETLDILKNQKPPRITAFLDEKENVADIERSGQLYDALNRALNPNPRRATISPRSLALLVANAKEEASGSSQTDLRADNDYIFVLEGTFIVSDESGRTLNQISVAHMGDMGTGVLINAGKGSATVSISPNAKFLRLSNDGKMQALFNNNPGFKNFVENQAPQEGFRGNSVRSPENGTGWVRRLVRALLNWIRSTTVIRSSAVKSSEGALSVQSQVDLKSRVDSSNPPKHNFVKDAPILGYRITSDKFEDIPEEIRRHLGETDKTKYTVEYLGKNIGSIFALQMNGDKPDFYVIGKDTFDQKYRAVAASEVGAKNAKLMNGLLTVQGMEALVNSNETNIVGALKTVPVEMIRMSEAGYGVDQEVTIQSPWGEQTKPAGKDAYLVWDSAKNQYYMVNTDDSRLPISYVAAKLPVQNQVDLKSRVTSANPPKHNFVKDAPILGYRITSARFEDLPDAIRQRLGEVDRTKYTEDYLMDKIGSIAVLQTKDGQPDFYIIGHDAFKNYRTVPVSEVESKNAKLMKGLVAVPGIDALVKSNDPNIVGALKTVPVEMIRMSEIGYAIDQEITIQASWGEQTKPAGKDAYLVWETSTGMYYMVNTDEVGLPISYVVGSSEVKSPESEGGWLRRLMKRLTRAKSAPIEEPKSKPQMSVARQRTEERDEKSSEIENQLRSGQPISITYKDFSYPLEAEYYLKGYEVIAEKVPNTESVTVTFKAPKDESREAIEVTVIMPFQNALESIASFRFDGNQALRDAPESHRQTIFGFIRSHREMMASLAGQNKIQGQLDLKSRIDSANPSKHTFVKDAPILGYRITSDKFEDIPEEIRRHLGETDKTKYTAEYLGKNIGSIFALQMNGDKPDFYVVGKETFDQKYRTVAVSEVGAKNAKLMKGLLTVPGVEALVKSNNANVVGALKTVPVEMIRMSNIGYAVDQTVTIQSPWGEQTKPAGKDAYLVWDSGKNQYYMVNTDDSGLPISYVTTIEDQLRQHRQFLAGLKQGTNPFKTIQVPVEREVSLSFEEIKDKVEGVLSRMDGSVASYYNYYDAHSFHAKRNGLKDGASLVNFINAIVTRLKNTIREDGRYGRGTLGSRDESAMNQAIEALERITKEHDLSNPAKWSEDKIRSSEDQEDSKLEIAINAKVQSIVTILREAGIDSLDKFNAQDYEHRPVPDTLWQVETEFHNTIALIITADKNGKITPKEAFLNLLERLRQNYSHKGTEGTAVQSPEGDTGWFGRLVSQLRPAPSVRTSVVRSPEGTPSGPEKGTNTGLNANNFFDRVLRARAKGLELDEKVVANLRLLSAHNPTSAVLQLDLIISAADEAQAQKRKWVTTSRVFERVYQAKAIGLELDRSLISILYELSKMNPNGVDEIMNSTIDFWKQRKGLSENDNRNYAYDRFLHARAKGLKLDENVVSNLNSLSKMNAVAAAAQMDLTVRAAEEAERQKREWVTKSRVFERADQAKVMGFDLDRSLLSNLYELSKMNPTRVIEMMDSAIEAWTRESSRVRSPESETGWLGRLLKKLLSFMQSATGQTSVVRSPEGRGTGARNDERQRALKAAQRLVEIMELEEVQDDVASVYERNRFVPEILDVLEQNSETSDWDYSTLDYLDDLDRRLVDHFHDQPIYKKAVREEIWHLNRYAMKICWSKYPGESEGRVIFSPKVANVFSQDPDVREFAFEFLRSFDQGWAAPIVIALSQPDLFGFDVVSQAANENPKSFKEVIIAAGLGGAYRFLEILPYTMQILTMHYPKSMVGMREEFSDDPKAFVDSLQSVDETKFYLIVAQTAFRLLKNLDISPAQIDEFSIHLDSNRQGTITRDFEADSDRIVQSILRRSFVQVLHTYPATKWSYVSLPDYYVDLDERMDHVVSRIFGVLRFMYLMEKAGFKNVSAESVVKSLMDASFLITSANEGHHFSKLDATTDIAAGQLILGQNLKSNQQHVEVILSVDPVRDVVTTVQVPLVSLKHDSPYECINRINNGAVRLREWKPSEIKSERYGSARYKISTPEESTKLTQALQGSSVQSPESGSGWFGRLLRRLLNSMRSATNQAQATANTDEAGSKARIFRDRGITYTGRTLRPGQEDKVSVKYFEIYEMQLSPEVQAKIEQAVANSNGRLMLLTREEMVQARLNKQVGDKSVAIAVADNAPAILDHFDQLTESDWKTMSAVLPEGSSYGEWRGHLDQFKDVRVSAASLVRIKVGNRYLLMRYKKDNPDGSWRYIPVGGGLTYADESRVVLESMGASKFEGDDKGEKDLRFTIPRQNLETFETWFKRAEGRETDPIRELREELVDEEHVLTANEFESILNSIRPFGAGHSSTVKSPEGKSEKSTEGEKENPLLATSADYDIDSFARRMVAVQKEKGSEVYGRFNGMDIRVTGNETVGELVQQFIRGGYQAAPQKTLKVDSTQDLEKAKVALPLVLAVKWEAMRKGGDEAWYQSRLPVIMALAVAREPIPVELIAQFSGVTDPTLLASILNELDPLLEKTQVNDRGQAQTRYFPITAFREFVEKKDGHEKGVDIKEAHGKVADSIMSKLDFLKKRTGSDNVQSPEGGSGWIGRLLHPALNWIKEKWFILSFVMKNGRLTAGERAILNTITSSKDQNGLEAGLNAIIPVVNMGVNGRPISRDGLINLQRQQFVQSRAIKDLAVLSLLMDRNSDESFVPESQIPSPTPEIGKSNLKLHLLDPDLVNIDLAGISKGLGKNDTAIVYVGANASMKNADPRIVLIPYSSDALSVDSLKKMLGDRNIPFEKFSRMRIRINKNAVAVQGATDYIQALEILKASMPEDMYLLIPTPSGISFAVPVVAKDLLRMVEFEGLVRRMVAIQA